MSTLCLVQTIDQADTPIVTTIYDLVAAIQEVVEEDADNEEEADLLACVAILGLREHIRAVDRVGLKRAA
ncbi:MAG: hypothetical protein V3V08_00390 [Nannocystaceae bacterium]